MNKKYDSDFSLWSTEQANALAQRQYEKLDLQNLIEEIESLGKSQRRSLESHLAIWILHELKIRYQPEKHTRSWDLSIKNAKSQFFKYLDRNPSLHTQLTEILQDSYEMARWRALDETNLLEEDIPEKCIFDVEFFFNTK